MEMKYLRIWTETTETSLTKRIQDMEERISVIEYTMEEMDTSVKDSFQ